MIASALPTRPTPTPSPSPSPSPEPSPSPTPASSPASERREPTAAAKPDRPAHRKPTLIVVAAVAAVAVVIGATALILTLGQSGTGPAPAPALETLLTVSDLGDLGGIDWTEPTADANGVRPACLPATATEELPAAQRSSSRRIASGASPLETVVQNVDIYADEASAIKAYTARLTQLGTCPGTVALITSAETISGLADTADATRVTVQEAENQFHTLVVTRTGRNVNVFDVAASRSIATADVASAAARALSRQCSNGEQGRCPGSIEISPSVPAAGSLPGWLVEADLPRITPGAGRWGALDPATSLSVVGSQCEAVNLQTITGTTATGQRTFLLADDANAPTGFGVDQAVYTFADAKSAEELADKLAKNLAKCPDVAPTASVEKGANVKGTGAGGVSFTGSTYLVTQTTQTTKLVFRVAVVTVDNRVAYLLANSSTNFDFTDEAWQRVAERAGQRVSQS